MTTLPDLIKSIREDWMECHGWETPDKINNGLCNFFAEAVKKQWRRGEVLWDDQNWHSFLFYDGKYYDSECPEGVDHPKQLPFYGRFLPKFKERASFEAALAANRSHLRNN